MTEKEIDVNTKKNFNLENLKIIHGDCQEIMKCFSDNSIDFVVTDPPYGINFLNKLWDRDIPYVEIWEQCLRVCKPGSMLAAFGGSRTHHHLMIAIEKAGWEIRDCIMWIYGSGFPKSHNHFDLAGYGTALKPAYEPIIIAMKPLEGTYKENAEKWGIGGINVDVCRIGFEEEKIIEGTKGRWPANIILDEESAKMLDEQTGELRSGGGNRRPNGGGKMFNGFKPQEAYFRASSGGASRFFYCAKASQKERNKGLDEKLNHPTVKPISLMKYLLKLLAPPGDSICLDPFSGSGSTLIAARELGIRCIGIEKEEEYFKISKKRVHQ